jgi:hypothetical protein
MQATQYDAQAEPVTSDESRFLSAETTRSVNI